MNTQNQKPNTESHNIVHVNVWFRKTGQQGLWHIYVLLISIYCYSFDVVFGLFIRIFLLVPCNFNNLWLFCLVLSICVPHIAYNTYYAFSMNNFVPMAKKLTKWRKRWKFILFRIGRHFIYIYNICICMYSSGEECRDTAQETTEKRNIMACHIWCNRFT